MSVNCMLHLKTVQIDKEGLKRLLPHRDIALSVIDSAYYDPTTKESKNKIVAFKKTVPDDPYFIGHYPGNPAFPGHWQFEAMCLTAALLFKEMPPYCCLMGQPAIAGTDGKVRFIRPVFPGDELEIHAELTGQRQVGDGLHLYFATHIKRGSQKISYIEKLIGSLFTKKE